MYCFELPDIGEGVVEAEVIEWKVREGDLIAEDQVFVELMTDKATIEIPSPRAGRVHKLCYAEGDIVEVGATLIEIDENAGAGDRAPSAPTSEPASKASAPQAESTPPQPASRPPAPTPQTAPAAVPAPQAPAAAAPPKSAEAPRPGSTASPHPPAMPARPVAPRHPGDSEGRDGARAVPAIRDLARRLEIDLDQVRGTGPGGRVMRRDVERYAAANSAVQAAVPTATATEASASIDSEEGPRESAPEASAPLEPAQRDEAPRDPADWERVPLRGLRRAISKHMLEARRRTAHFTYAEELDLTALLAARDRIVAEQKLEGLSPLAFIARAVVRSLPDFPMLSASIDDARQEIVIKRNVHLGIAVAANDALVVPVIENAGRLSTVGLAHEIAHLAERARDNALTPAELRGSTFTITSLGRLGGIISTPILNYPESAILGVNAVRLLPRYVDGELAPRSMMNLSISVDHRIADGLIAANFIVALREILEGADFPDLFG